MKDPVTPSIVVELHASGAILPVKAQAGARKSGLAGEHGGALRVSVTQAPEKGKANKAIVDVLSKSLDLRRSQIELLSGETTAHKRFLIRHLSPVELLVRLAVALQEQSNG